jgi:glycolate dehydrogenase FAD-binding subunit
MTISSALTLEEGLAQLGVIVGPADTRLDGDAIHVAPGSAEQIAEVLRFANEYGLSVVPTGGRTKLGWGNPVAPEIFLSLARMNAVREHAWQDLTCSVEAGCTWAAMRDSLSRHGQTVALDPLWPERATVGGVVATNDSGALRLRYGGLRDLIIGMTVVLADGTIAKTGGKVVKNVAGYDLHKLMTGSFGTLGVIAEVNFRLHPVEQHTQTWTISGNRDALADLMMRAHASTMQVSGMQMRGLHRESSDRLDIRFAGRPECLSRHEQQLRTMAGSLEMKPAGEDVWQAREKLADDAGSRDALVFKATMLPGEIAAVQKRLAAWPGETISVTQATGIMTAAALGGTMQFAMLIDELREMVQAAGGSVVVLRMPQASSPQPDVWGCASDALPLMREIKRRFDPNRVLNPCRFVGGI